MKLKRLGFLLLLTVFCANSAMAQHSMLFSGGPLYDDIKDHAFTVKTSGFNTLVLWSMHIGETGDLIYNGPTLISNGVYVGYDWWPEEVMNLKGQGSSIERIEFSIGAWGVQDFERIQALIASEGTGPSSTLYRNFQKLKEVLDLDAIDFDDESNYDVSSTVEFSKMLIELGYKITLCPYTNSSFWKSVYDQVIAYSPGAVDRIYLQCYAGGGANNPADWNTLFDGLNVAPGLWCKHGSGCNLGDSPLNVRTKLTNWNSATGLSGGFIWYFDDLLNCGSGSSTGEYAQAILDAFGVTPVIPEKATEPSPQNSSVEVSVDEDLSWEPGSYNASHNVYFGLSSTLSEYNLVATRTFSNYELPTLINNTTYYWRIDEVNDAGTTTGDVWQFTTEVITLPAEKAFRPSPENGEEDIVHRTVLSWSPGKGTVSHNLYFGESNTPAFIGNTKDSIFIPQTLKSFTKYFWRIDEVNSADTTVGDIWSFTVQPANIAPLAQVSVSSYDGASYDESRLIDSIILKTGSGEWASKGEQTPWAKLEWNEAFEVYKVILYDRPNGIEKINAGKLSFSDGTSVSVGQLPDDGSALVVEFEPRIVTWIQVDVTEGQGPNVGLAEFEVFSKSVLKDPPGKACVPYPFNNALRIETQPKLTWKKGFNALSHNLFFGETQSPEFIENLTNNSFQLDKIKSGTTYFWRIDEVNQNDTTKGDLWQFKTIGTSDLQIKEQKEIAIYPNPVNKNLHLKSEMLIRKISIQSYNGKIEKSQLIDNRNVMLELTDLVPGNYILIIELMKGQTFKKHIVKL